MSQSKHAIGQATPSGPSLPPSSAQASVSPAFMAVYTFLQFSHWLAILTPVTITIAMRIGTIAPPDQKSAYLASIMSIGAFFAMVAAPFWGAVSDHTRSRLGRRRLWISLGALFLLAGLMLMAFTTSIWLFGLGWVICQVGSNAAQAAINALLPDQVPLHQRGRMSSLLGLTTILATVAGTFLTQYTLGSSVAMFLVPWLPCLLANVLMFAIIPDAPSQSEEGISLASVFSVFRVNPFKSWDFGCVFASRFLLATGNAFAQTYQVFVLIDVIGLVSGQVPRALLGITSTVAVISLILTPLAGWLVDKTGRMKPLVVATGLVATLGLAILTQTHTLQPYMLAMIVLGVGKSVFYAMATAISATVLPSKSSAAKDMGIIQIANSLPQSLAPAIAPAFLAIGGGSANYDAMFMAATLFAAAGTLAILPIRHVR
jgi:MFS family permease